MTVAQNVKLDSNRERAPSTEVETGGKTADEKKESKKLTIGQKIKKELHHYWDGTKLLAAEVRISSQLALKMAAGYELSRRENKQVRAALSFPHVHRWITNPIRVHSSNERFEI